MHLACTSPGRDVENHDERAERPHRRKSSVVKETSGVIGPTGENSMRKSLGVLGAWLLIGMGLMACSRDPAASPAPAAIAEQQRSSILLVSLDTTRADRMGFEFEEIETPNLDELAARGVRFSHAYATAPMTLPSHTSMLTGLYPAGHGVHQNGWYVAEEHVLLASLLKNEGYSTAAFLSSFALASEFGLNRGFDLYDDDLGAAGLERDAIATTDRALDFLGATSADPLFLWVHYFDPHEPYEPPEPFRSRYQESPYLGEIALMDREFGRLLGAFEAHCQGGDFRILVVGDHGQGLGEHGEDLHGKLLYQGVMRVPMVIAGSTIAGGTIDHPVSVRRVFDTILAWARGGESAALLDGGAEIVMAEALKPYLDYGWQPQVMAISDRIKVIRSGETEIYDLATDPLESNNLAGEIELDDELRRAVEAYPIYPNANDGEPSSLGPEARERLAALGYVSSDTHPVLRDDAPNPKDMTHLFHDLNVGSTMFLHERYDAAIPFFERVLAGDPGNSVACLRLAVSHSVLGHGQEAAAYFARARDIDPDSLDLRHFYAAHLFRFGMWDEAEPLLESVLIDKPRHVGILISLVQIRERQGRIAEARGYLRRAMALEEPEAFEFLKLGEYSMALQDTPAAIQAFENARQLEGKNFTHSLELGVCYMAIGRLPEAARAFDAVPRSDPEYAFALYKRAQVAILLGEPDRDNRIQLAHAAADQEIRELMASDPLFQGFPLR
jgi:tetratricopeptide (TPR) repeat protein